MYQFTNSLSNRKHSLTMPAYDSLTVAKREASKFYANKKAWIMITDCNMNIVSIRVQGVWKDQ